MPRRVAATGSPASSLAVGPTTTRSTTGCAKAPPLTGYVGFAIGRSIWGDPLKDWIDGNSSREDAAVQIADNYLRFVEVYAAAVSPSR